MVADRENQAIAAGDDVVVIGRARSVASDRTVLVSAGHPVHVEPELVLRADDVAAAVRSANMRTAYRFSNTGTTGWTTSATGGGSVYPQDPQYESVLQSANVLGAVAIDTGPTTTGTNAGLLRKSNAIDWLVAGRKIVWRWCISNGSELGTFRIGLWSANGGTPSHTGRPTFGSFLEYDLTGAGVLQLVTVASGGTTTQNVGVAAPTSPALWGIERVSGSALSIYDLDADPDTPLCTVSSNVASLSAERSGWLFGQASKKSGGTTSRGKVFLEEFGAARRAAEYLGRAV